MSGYIAAFEKFAATTELTNVTLEGLKAVFKVLPDSFDAMDIKIMLTDEADCDEILEKYVAINKTEANVLFKTRTELCDLVGKFSESEFAQNITEEAVAAPAAAAPAVAVNAHIAAFSTFAFNAKMSHVTLEGLEAVFKVLPESYDAMDLQIMLTDEADCDELLEKYVSINKTPANELFKVRTELCELVGQFAESEELQNVAAAIVAPAEAAPAVEAPAVNAHIAAFSTFAFNAKMSHVTLEGLEAVFKVLPESYDAMDLQIMLTDEADCDELLEKYVSINKTPANELFKVRTELCELVGQFAESEELQNVAAAIVAPAEAAPAVEAPAVNAHIAAFSTFAFNAKMSHVTLEGLEAVFKVLPESYDAMDLQIMLTDEADCDELLEKYVSINKTPANELFKVRTELCELVGQFAESEELQNVAAAIVAPAEAAPVVEAPAVNAHIAAFSTFAFNAKMSHVTLEGLEAVFKVLPESYDAMDLQIMLTDEADCDELLEKYVSINKTPANELFKVRTELCELVGQFAESEELQNVAAAIVAPAEAAPAVEAPAVNAHIAAFSTFAFNAKMSHVTLEGLEAVFKVLPESYDAMDLQIMLTDEADCDELLEKYVSINKTPANELFKVRTELCELVGQFAESEELQNVAAAIVAPAEAAPAVEAPAVNAHIAAFSTFAFNAKMSHVTLEGLEAVFKVLPESYDAMDLQIMLTDEADCDELLEKYVSINKTPANELFKVRTELCELVGQFAESEELQNVAAAIVAPAEAAPAVEAPAVNAHIAAFSTFAFNAKMSHVTLEGLEAVFKVLPESYDAMDLQIMLTDEADCDELLEKYVSINKTPANELFKVRTELCELVGQFAESEELQNVAAAIVAPAEAAPAVEAPAVNAHIAAFSTFAFNAKMSHVTLEGLEATFKILPESYDAIDLKIMLTDEADCDELLEKYTAINKIQPNDMFKVRTELCELVGQFAETEEAQALSAHADPMAM